MNFFDLVFPTVTGPSVAKAIAVRSEPAPPAPAFRGILANPKVLPAGYGNLLERPNNYGGPPMESKIQAEAYKRSRYLAMTVNLISNAASKRYHLFRADGAPNIPSEAAIIESFLNCPNPRDTFGSLMQQIIISLCLHGGSILEFHTSPVDAPKIKALAKSLDFVPDMQSEIIDSVGSLPQAGAPVYLSSLPFEQMEIVTDNMGVILKYRQHTVYGGIVEFDPSEIIHIRGPKSRSVYGDSPIRPILSTVALDELVTKHHLHRLEKDAIIDTVITLTGSLSQDEATAMTQELNDKFVASGSQGNFVVLGDNIKWETVGQSAKDGEYLKLSETLRNIIAMTFHVSPSILGDSAGTGGTSGSNYSAGTDTQYRIFVNHAVAPLALHVESLLNRQLLSHFGAIGLEYKLALDLLDDNDTADVELMFDQQVKNGTKNINEVRASRGQQPVPGGDVNMIYVASGAVPVEEAAKGAPEVEPPAPIHILDPNAPVAPPAVPVAAPEPPDVTKAIAELRGALRTLRKAQ